jgi:hypothetical protein
MLLFKTAWGGQINFSAVAWYEIERISLGDIARRFSLAPRGVPGVKP